MDAGFRSIASAARAFKARGAHPQNWRDHEAGLRPIQWKHAEQYGAWLKVGALYLLTGQREASATLIPVRGYVGAGAQVFPMGEQELEPIPAPPGARLGDVAFHIRGASMGDFRDGGIIVCRPVYDIADTLYRKAVVDLLDGRRFFKQIVPGTIAKHYTLLSLTNGEAPIENVMIEGAARLKVYIEPDT